MNPNCQNPQNPSNQNSGQNNGMSTNQNNVNPIGSSMNQFPSHQNNSMPTSSMSNSMPNHSMNQMMNGSNQYRPQQTNVPMPMPTPSPNRVITPSPSPGPSSYNIRSPAPAGVPPASSGQAMRVTTPNMNSFNPNMMGQMTPQNPQGFQGNFGNQPNQMRPNNTQQHVNTMLQSVAKPTMVQNQQGGMPNQMNQMPPGMQNQMRMQQMNMGNMNMMGPNQMQMNPGMMHRPGGQVYGQPMGMNMPQNMRPMAPMNPRMAMTNGNHPNDGTMMVQSGPNQQMANPNHNPNVPPNQQQLSNQANSTATQDPEKRKMIQNQLIILIHAAKCTKRNDAQGTQCQIPHCQTMKNVLEHLPSCQMAKNCPVQHCSSSRHIIAHWKQCKNQQCQVCQPLKHPNSNDPNRAVQGNAPGTTNEQGQRPPTADQPGQQPAPGGQNNTNNPNQVANGNWRADVNSELREHLVKKLVSAIFPGTDQTNNSTNANDERIVKLFSFARRVEEDMYNKATTREDYYHMLAEKIYKIQKELELKRNPAQNPAIAGGPNQGPNQGPGMTRPPNPQFPGQNQQNPGQGQNPGMPQQGVQQPGGFQNNQGPGNMHQQPNQQPSGQQGWNQQNPGQPGAQNSGQMNSGKPGQSFMSPSTPNNQNQNQQLPNSNMVKSEPGVEAKPNVQNSQQNPSKSFNNQQSNAEDVKPQNNTTQSSFKNENEPMIKQETPEAKTCPIKREAQSPAPSPSPVSKKQKEEVKEETDPGTLKKWSAQELRDMLMPIWRKVYEHQDAPPFQIPVDPVALGIPDYPEVIKNPMDLSTMNTKLEMGTYEEPWEFIKDMWLMFENAWLYNKKNSRVYRMCTKLKEEFLRAAEPAMRRNGFCCAQSLTWTALPLCCFGKTTCTISVGSWYYCYESDGTTGPAIPMNVPGPQFSEKIYYCEKCFGDAKGDTIATSSDPDNPALQPKTKFSKSKNDTRDFEPFQKCKRCGRKNHQICVLYKKEIWKDFICDFCQDNTSKRRKKNPFTAENLPETELSKFIESKVNGYVTANDKNNEAGHVYIRTVFVGNKAVETRPGVRKEGETAGYPIAEKFKFRAKVLFAFEQIEGVDVCFFGLHVQEYDDKCPSPNQRRVYIGYLDSVKFFQPACLRTGVYHELIMGYLEYCRNLGYVWAHIWSCPPSEGDDYIFHCHPQEMKMPRSKRLCDWYRTILNKAQDRGVITEFKDIHSQAKDDGVVCATQMPYFDGDFWPTAIEDLIAEVLKEQAAEEAEMANDDGMYSDKAKSKKKNQKRNKNNKGGGDLMSKLNSLMERHKEVFFVIRMHSADSVPALPAIEDPDKDMPCDLMDGRDPFLNKARDEHWEFSTLRRTKYSSMCFLYTLHNPDNRFSSETFSCNNCDARITTRFHCKVCSDFDLCAKCNDAIGSQHEHQPLEKKVANNGIFGGNNDNDSMSSNEKRREGIQQCIQNLVHSAKCRDANCNRPNCQKMKKIIEHSKRCAKMKQKQKNNQQCNICKQFIALCCYHAKHCEEKSCKINYCAQIKQRLRMQQESTRRRQEKLMRRRMARPELEAPATPGPATPGPPTPSMGNPGTPNTNVASKGGMQGSSKLGQMQNNGKLGQQQNNPMQQQMHQYSSSPNMMNQRQMQYQGQGGAPTAAIKAANKVVQEAIQEGNKSMRDQYNPPQSMYNQIPQQNPPFRSQGYNMPTSQQQQQGTMFITQRPNNHNSPMNTQQQPQQHIDNTIKIIKESTDPKDPKILNVLKQNPQHVAQIFRDINPRNPNQTQNRVMISAPNNPQMQNQMSNMQPNMINAPRQMMQNQMRNWPQNQGPRMVNMMPNQMSNNMGNSQMYQMNQMGMMQSGQFGNQMNRGPSPQNTRFQMSMSNNGMQPNMMQNNMMSNGPMMGNGMGGGMGAQQNMMRPQQPQMMAQAPRFQQPGMSSGQSMMFNQGDPPLGQQPNADPSQSYAQTVDGL